MHVSADQVINKINQLESDHFLQNATLETCLNVKADYLFIAKINHQAHSSKTISLANKGSIIDNVEYALEDTPCANVADDSICCYPNEVAKLFPLDQMLTDMKIEGYVGAPLKNSEGKVIGLIVALFDHEVTNASEITFIFNGISKRIEKELVH